MTTLFTTPFSAQTTAAEVVDGVDLTGRPVTVTGGAATSVLLAASPLVEGISGQYFEDCNEAGPNEPGTRRGRRRARDRP